MCDRGGGATLAPDMKLHLLTTAAVVALGAASWAGTNSALAEVNAGDAIDFTFAEAPLNSVGLKSFADLKGRPVLIEFWGTT